MAVLLSMSKTSEVSRSEKIHALVDVARFSPRFSILIVILGLFAAVLEGIGLSFILPIIEIVQVDDPVAEADGYMEVFVTVYQTLGIPITLGFVVVGVAVVMTLRYTMTFLVSWLQAVLIMRYTRSLQLRAFDHALDAQVSYYDTKGSDDVLNAIITETRYAAYVIRYCIRILKRTFFTFIYLLIALVVSPILTLFAVIVLGSITVLLRGVIEPGYQLGDQVAEANERRQQAAQAGTQGIRDIRIFGITGELYNDFADAVDTYTRSRITLKRNEAALENFYNLSVAVFLFVLIYFALTFADLSLSALGVFLFAMFQLGPNVSKLNKTYYKIENHLPHLVRIQRFLTNLESQHEPKEGTQPVPGEIRNVRFDNVWFSYNDDDKVLRGFDFEVDKGEFVAFVGQSGAGKSTIVSLLARMYDVDRGEIRANGIPINEMDTDEWRDRISVVRQSPFIFNDTLRYNLTIGNRGVTESQLDRVCEIARVDEFLDDLPDGYDTMLGDDGVRLSGGQKQRVALARSLLEDADLLILDEATSDLDSNLEQQVQEGIESMDRDYAIITIAHRLSTVKNADRIYTVEDGKIIEFGQHNELLKNDGPYSDLYLIQSEG